MIICEAEWVGVLAQYRQMLCEHLARQVEMPQPHKSRPHTFLLINSKWCLAWLHDPLLATLPRMLDRNPQLAAHFHRLLSAQAQKSKRRDGGVSAGDFRTLYLGRIFPLLGSVESIPLDSSPIAADPIAILAEVGQKPFEMNDYYLHLNGAHAID